MTTDVKVVAVFRVRTLFMVNLSVTSELVWLDNSMICCPTNQVAFIEINVVGLL